MSKKASKKSTAGKKPTHGLGSGLSRLLGDDVMDEALRSPIAAPPVSPTSSASPVSAQAASDKRQARSGASEASERVTTVLPIGRLRASESQPRRDFAESELRELAESLRSTGVLQPILVVAEEGDNYRIVAGERRWRAAQLAGLHEVPVIVRRLTEEQILQVALIENIQRQDLNIVEEASAYSRLRDDFGHKQDDIADMVGKSRSYVANVLRLLHLPKAVLEFLRRGDLSLGHVRGLVNHADAEVLAKRMVAENLNVRQAEALAKSAKGGASGKSGKSSDYSSGDSVSLRQLQKDLGELFGVKTDIRSSGRGYVINLRFRDTGDLNDFIKTWRGRG